MSLRSCYTTGSIQKHDSYFFPFRKLTLDNYDEAWESFKGEYIDKINLCMRQVKHEMTHNKSSKSVVYILN